MSIIKAHMSVYLTGGNVKLVQQPCVAFLVLRLTSGTPQVQPRHRPQALPMRPLRDQLALRGRLL
jgi:hypothetical protein